MNFNKIIMHLKEKWGITSAWQFILINLVFAFAGMSIVFIRKPLFAFIGIEATTPFWIKTLVYIPFIIPTYQVNLLIFGFLLGQFNFFWEKEKAMAKCVGRIFSRPRTASSK